MSKRAARKGAGTVSRGAGTAGAAGTAGIASAARRKPSLDEIVQAVTATAEDRGAVLDRTEMLLLEAALCVEFGLPFRSKFPRKYAALVGDLAGLLRTGSRTTRLYDAKDDRVHVLSSKEPCEEAFAAVRRRAAECGAANVACAINEFYALLRDSYDFLFGWETREGRALSGYARTRDSILSRAAADVKHGKLERAAKCLNSGIINGYLPQYIFDMPILPQEVDKYFGVHASATAKHATEKARGTGDVQAVAGSRSAAPQSKLF